MENSNWLKGDKSVITSTEVDHDSVQVRFAACKMIRNEVGRFFWKKIESC